jgi:hypothetical protein
MGPSVSEQTDPSAYKQEGPFVNLWTNPSVNIIHYTSFPASKVEYQHAILPSLFFHLFLPLPVVYLLSHLQLSSLLGGIWLTPSVPNFSNPNGKQ